MNLFGFHIGRAPTKSRKSAYQGATVNRLTNDWPTSILSADAATRWNLRTLRARSRDLERNGGILERYLAAKEANIIGSNGVCLQMKARKNDGRTTTGLTADLDTATNQVIEKEWCEFGKRGNYDVTGKHSRNDFWRLALRTAARDGDALVLVYRGSTVPNKWKIAFQLLEGDYLDDLYNDRKLPNGNTVRMGVELDAFKRKVAFWIFATHPGDYGVEGMYTYDGRRLRIPAYGEVAGAPVECIHLTRTKRPEETRGVPDASPVMVAIKMLEGYEEAELVAARAQACKHVFYERNQFAPDGTPLDYPEDTNGQLVEDMEPGGATELPVGYHANFYSPTHPNQAFPDFVKSQKRRIAAGLSVAYNTLFVDLESVNYSSIRAGMLDERETWKMQQTWFRDDLVQCSFDSFLQMGLMLGLWPGLGITDFDRLSHAPVWNFRRWDWIDPSKDVRASVEAIAAKITTRTKVIADREGGDFEENMDQYAYEEQYMIERGIDPAPVAQTTEQIIDPNAEDNADPNAPNTPPSPAAPQQPHTRAFRIKRADGTEIKGEISDLREITPATKYSADQPRDDHGRWDGGGDDAKAISPDANASESGKPISAQAYRYGEPKGELAFYSKNRDYAEEYATERGGTPNQVHEAGVSLNKPLVVDAPDHSFSSPEYETPILEKARAAGYDGVVFKNNEDVFYAVFRK